ncbi:hypothetical protein OESDEN_17480 [Oesophagostomum dentatum]|uniref:Uncharacterized protein n=1 Tax=Oesophagostomum dentatum TaxID=61180 RepID=A0A0B1SHZ2_OESDE|nr:hypothetical protein OESDEN_17480 [Oesophagostomum dentatum]
MLYGLFKQGLRCEVQRVCPFVNPITLFSQKLRKSPAKLVVFALAHPLL